MGFFGNLTGWHLLAIVFLVLLLFGAPKLPGLAKSVGQSMKIFKNEVKSDKVDGDVAAKADAQVPTQAPTQAAPAQQAPVQPTYAQPTYAQPAPAQQPPAQQAAPQYAQPVAPQAPAQQQYAQPVAPQAPAPAADQQYAQPTPQAAPILSAPPVDQTVAGAPAQAATPNAESHHSN